MIHPLTPILGLVGPLGTTELIVLAILGVLIFGKRLPEVGRSIGKGIVEFKKGLAGIEDDAGKATTPPPPQVEARREPPRVEAQTDTTAGAPTPESTTHSA